MGRLEGWDNITLDEAIKEIKSLRQSLIGAVQNAECREEKKDKEIERLGEEKEWLIKLLYNKVCETPISLDAYKLILKELMQQALKEGE